MTLHQRQLLFNISIRSLKVHFLSTPNWISYGNDFFFIITPFVINIFFYLSIYSSIDEIAVTRTIAPNGIYAELATNW